ncbi:STAS domain-containing protein [Marinactinospora thermotolerans]|uniref:Anti-sigma factor antagonist n=1 Tax=Marinactinospora thermotolerans DSM 45154 TaxID=1122192 RepID=A0A1T4T2F7_9ACTN|nr:STAS domain-containing protein [Marinactinospora thermotolerans]SKA34694.1 anti-anti-sigma factor [Marinactinospora thermotolerans DSM 45154]
MSAGTPLEIQVVRAAGNVRLWCVGDLDHETVDELRECVGDLLAAGVRSLSIDLSGVDLCDSSGLSGLLHAHNSTRAAGAELHITGVSDRLGRIMSITGLNRILSCSLAGGAPAASPGSDVSTAAGPSSPSP